MKLVHPDNLPKGVDINSEKGMFGEDISKLRNILSEILSSGIPREIAINAGIAASDNPKSNMGILRGLMGSLLCNPVIFEFMGGKEDKYIEKVFFTAFSEMDIEPNPVGESIVPISLIKKED